jgi:excisionase family DNA binding protein
LIVGIQELVDRIFLDIKNEQQDRRVADMGKERIILPDPADIEPEKIAPVMAQMAAIQLSLAARLVAESTERAQTDADSLLTVEEAAAKLKCSGDWLYRQAKRLPFTVRVGRSLRFSSRGIDAHIRSGKSLI